MMLPLLRFVTVICHSRRNNSNNGGYSGFFLRHIMEIMSTIVWFVYRNDIIGAWCFQVLQCAVVQAFKRFGEQCLDKSYSHCHCVITLTQTFCDIPHEVP